jgi:multidrug resistance efflux pump
MKGGKMKKRETKKTLKSGGIIKRIKKEINEANAAVEKAKKEIREAERAIEKAQNEVFEVAEITRGKKKLGFTGAVRDLEKAVNLAAESSESTEEAEFKVKLSRKKK